MKRLVHRTGFSEAQWMWWLAFVLIFAVHQVLEKVSGIHIRMLDDHLDVFLLLPIVMPLILAEARFILNEPYFILPPAAVAGIALFFCFVSEWIFPAVSDRFTTDPWDVVFIFAGAVVFQILFNRK